MRFAIILAVVLSALAFHRSGKDNFRPLKSQLAQLETKSTKLQESFEAQQEWNEELSNAVIQLKQNVTETQNLSTVFDKKFLDLRTEVERRSKLDFPIATFNATSDVEKRRKAIDDLKIEMARLEIEWEKSNTPQAKREAGRKKAAAAIANIENGLWDVNSNVPPIDLQEFHLKQAFPIPGQATEKEPSD